MGKNIIICSDGTGNTFDHHVTNVTRLIRCLALNRRQQVAVYDQGLGTTASRCSTIETHRRSLEDPSALYVLPPPLKTNFGSLIDRGRGLLTGYGLKENVHEMYGALSNLYDGPDDQVFLFGFSRGAFTVRALAGLLYRCRLAPRQSADLDTRFERAWELFEPMQEDETATTEFRREQRPCHVHFLGLWDTVKSYGGLKPVMLPHLRHNPAVTHVRHALALDEHRAWFQATTWGQLDLDRKGAMTRIREEDEEFYRQQDIEEVWFAGCHSDIGGGDSERATAKIALRWMLGEAANVDHALLLNDEGRNLLKESDAPEPPQIHESWNRLWWAIEKVPREEIDNSRAQSFKKRARGSNGKRQPDKLRRSGKVFLHATVGATHSIPGEIAIRQTRSLPNQDHASAA